MKTIVRALRWLAEEAWEKINVIETWRELKKLGKRHGMRFFVFAVIWELIEDVLFPYFSWKAGMPALIPFFLVMHFEPLVYPAAFWAFRTYDRARGREPWEPERVAMSSHWRSAGKVGVYLIAASGYTWALLREFGYSPKIVLAFAGLMAAFGFIHERIWHDSNYGIGDNGRGDSDHVFVRRILAKTTTYAIVSSTILASLFKVSFGGIPWLMLGACQTVGLALYFVFEAVWARSKWGVSLTGRSTPVPDPAAPLVLGITDASKVVVISGNVLSLL